MRVQHEKSAIWKKYNMKIMQREKNTKEWSMEKWQQEKNAKWSLHEKGATQKKLNMNTSRKEFIKVHHEQNMKSEKKNSERWKECNTIKLQHGKSTT